MHQGKVFLNNRTQAVRLPKEARFDESIQQVNVIVLGKERILTPFESTWDSFFMSEEGVSEDFMIERPSQKQAEREAF